MQGLDSPSRFQLHSPFPVPYFEDREPNQPPFIFHRKIVLTSVAKKCKDFRFLISAYLLDISVV